MRGWLEAFMWGFVVFGAAYIIYLFATEVLR